MTQNMHTFIAIILIQLTFHLYLKHLSFVQKDMKRWEEFIIGKFF
jgi:hypothetical protein